MNTVEINCGICGAIVDNADEAVDNVVKCRFCGHKTVIPKVNQTDEVVELLNAARRALSLCKFDDAYELYRQASESDKEEPEAFFGKAIAKFKIQYIKDYNNARPLPICHAISADKICEDKDFVKAVKLSSGEQKKEYEERGKDIDFIMEQFGNYEKRGLNFEIFICTKVTDNEKGGKTRDWETACHIYEYLVEKGYRPFFSEKNIRNETGAQYEALILYALYKAKCMLVVCSEKEYLRTPYVQNEYTRYINMMKDGEKKGDSVTIIFEEKVIENLPGVRGKVQGIGLDRFNLNIGERIEGFVKKCCREEEIAREKAEEERQKAEEARKRAEQDEKRRAAEEAKRKEEEEKRIERMVEQRVAKMREEEAAARKKAEEEKRQEEARLKAEQEANRKKEAEEAKRRAEEEARKREESDPEYQNSMGEKYYYGRGVTQDYAQAVKWYRKSAEQGNAAAQKNLGWCYDNGQGVARDYSQAVYWYRKSAEQGNDKAQNNLGYCYKKGQGVSQDYAQAVYWFKKSAVQGNVKAQCNLGYCYNQGQGVSQDYTQGVYWYRKSADRGNVNAQFNLGLCYESGRGVKQSINDAVYWYEKAAAQGHKEAAGKLANLREKQAEEKKKREAAKPEVNAKEKTLTFGSYPQSRVTDSALVNALTTKAGTLPTSSNAQKWTSYKYYVEGKVKDYMWYIDVDHNGEKYRGVYFNSYRPYYTTYISSAGNSYQDDNGYTIGNVYWFKWEPINWNILKAENGEALILADMILDSQHYYHDSDEERTIDGKTIYPNNYAHSDIRAWLNDDFYNAAFTTAQKELIKQTLVDNSASTTANSSNSYARENTNDNIFLLSYKDMLNTSYGFSSSYSTYDTARRKKTTAYAQCQGAYTSTDGSYRGNGWWWLRSPNSGGGGSAGRVRDDGYVYYDTYVYCTDGGVCPALKITLGTM